MFTNYTETELALAISELLELPAATALRAVQSSDPDLGREWAIKLLQQNERSQQAQQRLSQRISNLRALATN